MAFVRAKRRGNRSYYYLVENKRQGKKVRQKVLRYLGASIPEDIESIKRELGRAKPGGQDDS